MFCLDCPNILDVEELPDILSGSLSNCHSGDIPIDVELPYTYDVTSITLTSDTHLDANSSHIYIESLNYTLTHATKWLQYNGNYSVEVITQ